MKVRIIKEGLSGSNKDGTYSNREVGTEIEHPTAWMLAVSDVGSAEPVDDEAEAKVAEAEERLKRRRAMFQPARVKATVTPPKPSKAHKAEK